MRLSLDVGDRVKKDTTTVATIEPMAPAFLMEIGDPDNIELVVELLLSNAVKVREGAIATIEGWGGTPLAAKVIRVEPAGFTKVSALGIEGQRVRAILQLQNAASDGRLGHEFRVFAKINIYETPDALRVPTRALFRRREQWAVYVVERGRARFLPVQIAHRNTAFAEVVHGMSEGSLVIFHPSDRVSDGVQVTAIARLRRLGDVGKLEYATSVVPPGSSHPWLA